MMRATVSDSIPDERVAVFDGCDCEVEISDNYDPENCPYHGAGEPPEVEPLLNLGRMIAVSILGGCLVLLGLYQLTHASGPSFSPTEQFIPIGESPGVSGKHSITGQVIAIGVYSDCWSGECSRPIFNVRDAAGKVHYILINKPIAVYLDRSRIRKPNTIGTLQDVQLDHIVEVYEHHWLKVRVEE